MRDSSIDIAKGIGIILIVLGHLPYGVSAASDWCTDFVYLFHVPLFFFLSGMFYKEGEKWGVFLKKKIKRLYVPYVAANLVFLAFYIISAVVAGDGNSIVPLDMCKHAVKICLLMAAVPLGFQMWFLVVLLFTVIMHKALDDLFVLLVKRRELRMVLLSLTVICLAALGYSKSLPFVLDRSFVALLFFFIGRMCYSGGRYKKIVEMVPFPAMVGIALAAFIVCALATHTGHPVPADGDYGNPLVFTAVAMTGIVMTLSFSVVVGKSATATNFVAGIGRETMAILIGQFAAFKIVDVIRPGELSPIWLLLMFVAGVGLPYLIVRTFRFLKKTVA